MITAILTPLSAELTTLLVVLSLLLAAPPAPLSLKFIFEGLVRPLSAEPSPLIFLVEILEKLAVAPWLLAEVVRAVLRCWWCLTSC